MRAGIGGLFDQVPRRAFVWCGERELIAGLHFIGTEDMAGSVAATNLNSIAALPATAALRDLFLKKLAGAPFRLVHQRHPEITSDYAGLLRPIMDDLLRSESYWEMRGPSNAVPEVILGARLDHRRAELWRD